jgi:SAM-dependent methyltransferase
MSTTPSQTELWNGASGRRWVAQQAALDRALEPFGAAALQHGGIQPGHRVLDVGTGCGATALAIAGMVGAAGHVCGIDISQPMLELARQRAAGADNIALLEGDAQSFAFTGRFDVVYSRFGVMFFADPRAAFRNLRSALLPNGRLIFVSWRCLEDNPWVHVPLSVARSVWPQMPSLPNDDGPGPLALADRERVVDILSSAGFRQIGIERFDAHVSFGGSLDEAVEFAIAGGPLARLLAEATASIRAQICIDLQQTLREHRTVDSFGLDGSVWVVTAVNPA